MGKQAGSKKMEDPPSLKSNETAKCSFAPQQPLVCDAFKKGVALSVSIIVGLHWRKVKLH